MNMIEGTELRVAGVEGAHRHIAALATGALEPRVLSPAESHTFVLPEGYRIEDVEVDESQLPGPLRKRGTARPATIDSLIDYVQRHQTPSTTVWVHPTDGKIIAVLDDHAASVTDGSRDTGDAGHRDHCARLDLLHTPEWEFWTGKDRHGFSQETFTEHIEDGVKEIVEPEPTAMLEIASTFHAKGEVNFSKVTNLQSGDSQLTYNDTSNAQAGESGELTIPRVIKLAIAPFVGGPRYEVIARFRYKVREGRLTLTYRLDRPHDVVRHALDEIADNLAVSFPGVVFIGEPRS